MSDLRSMAEVLADADRSLREGRGAAAAVAPTGFPLVDTYLGGGLRAGELTLLGGPQGLGKTTFVLQAARNIAAAGGAVVLFSYEHDYGTLLERLIAIESAAALGAEGVTLRRVRQAMERGDGRTTSLLDRLAYDPGGEEALSAIWSYGPRLSVHRSSGASTSLEVIADVAEEARTGSGLPPVVIVDYLQKVHVPDGSTAETERVTVVAEGLKDFALAQQLPVLAVAAADRQGMAPGQRLRVHHLRGASALAYEADVVLILNDKYDVVARHHVVYDMQNAERFRDFVVLSIEKNRSGLAHIDLEFRKRFEQGRFDPDGAAVAEQLVEGRADGQ